MFLDTLNQIFILVTFCSHFPKKFYSQIAAAILPSVAIYNKIQLIINDFQHNQDLRFHRKSNNSEIKRYSLYH